MIKFFANRWSRYGLAAFAGLLLAAAFPNLSIAGFAWIAPALMAFAARGSRGWQSFRIGCVGGFAFWLGSLYWLLLIPVNWYPILGWLALSAYLSLFSGLWVWLVSGARYPRLGVTWMRRMVWALGGAAAWVALEMIRARFLGGFPWNLLGVSQLKILPLVQIASITGVHGVSFLVVWTSLSLLNAINVILGQPTKRVTWQAEILLPFVVVAVVFVGGLFKLRQLEPDGPTLRVSFVQPSIPQTVIWNPAEDVNRFQQLMALSEKAVAGGSDLLLWPEAALPSFDESSYTAITNLIRANHVWMILGADDVLPHPTKNNPDEKDYFNAAFLFNPAGEFSGAYHKRNLVIFGEYIPLVRWLPFLKWFTTITGSYAAGDKPATFEINREIPKVVTIGGDADGESPKRTVKTSPLICYEDMFPQLGPGSAGDDVDFLVNLTNDGWFGEKGEQWQHANAAAFRAIENGLPLLRCCNNGVTCWIDSCGRFQQIFHDEKGSVYGMGAMTVEIPVSNEKRSRTVFNHYGDWFGWLCVALTGANAALSLRKKSAA